HRILHAETRRTVAPGAETELRVEERVDIRNLQRLELRVIVSPELVLLRGLDDDALPGQHIRLLEQPTPDRVRVGAPKNGQIRRSRDGPGGSSGLEMRVRHFIIEAGPMPVRVMAPRREGCIEPR